MLMTLTFAELACAISAARSETLLVDTAPERMIASSVALTPMSSPGKSARSCCCKRRDRRLDDEVVVLAIGVAPDDQADRAGRLAVDQDLAVLDDDGVGDGGIGDGDADDLEIRPQDRRSSRGQHHALDLTWQRHVGADGFAGGCAACAGAWAPCSRPGATARPRGMRGRHRLHQQADRDDGTGGGMPHLITSPLLASTLLLALARFVLDHVVRALHAADGFDRSRLAAAGSQASAAAAAARASDAAPALDDRRRRLVGAEERRRCLMPGRRRRLGVERVAQHSMISPSDCASAMRSASSRRHQQRDDRRLVRRLGCRLSGLPWSLRVPAASTWTLLAAVRVMLSVWRRIVTTTSTRRAGHDESGDADDVVDLDRHRAHAGRNRRRQAAPRPSRRACWP